MIKALIVDDEYLVRLGLKTTIPWTDLGIEIVGDAGDGETGLEMTLEHRPDLIITDVKMPFLNGIEFMKRVSESRLSASFIVLSGYGDFDYAKSAIHYGAVEYILKPIENEKLIEVLRRVKSRIVEERTLARLGQVKVVGDLLTVLKQIRIKKTKLTSKLTEEAIHYIQSNYAEDLSVASIAGSLHISASYLMHVFKEETQQTIVDYVTEYRMEQAKALLKVRKYKIYEISEMVGYRDPRYFGQLFKKWTGMTPKDHIKSKLYE
jgi:two-component system response regulator YesN